MKDNYLRSQSIAEKYKSSYLLNPLNSFKLTKRLGTDFDIVKSLALNQKIGLKDIGKNLLFPSFKDLIDMKENLLRLQRVYKLNTTLLAEGLLIPYDYIRHRQLSEKRHSFTSSECYKLGVTAYLNEDYYQTIVWMEEAMNRLEKSISNKDRKRDILEYIAFSKYKTESLREALDLTKQILLLFPNYSMAANNVKMYEEELSQLSMNENKSSIDSIISYNARQQTHQQLGETRHSLTSSECYGLGVTSYVKKDFYHTIVWMEEAMNRLEKDNPEIDKRADILRYIAFSKYKTGNIKEALELTKQILLLFPNDTIAANNVKGYERQLSLLSLDNNRADDRVVSLVDAISEMNNTWTSSENQIKILEALCRGEKGMSDKIQSKLVCFYLNTTKTPYLRLMRIKAEEAYKRPHIVIFHDIITDFEIEIIKTIAKPKLRQSPVQDFNTGITYINYTQRVSQYTFVADKEHEAITRISRRLSYITGLDISNVVGVQVQYYRVGGHFHCHYDHDQDAFYTVENGNLIASFLTYLNDVEAGGATVFPFLGVTVWPKKGSGVFWYNLYSSGDGDSLTLHSGCPLLMGNKWIFAKWFNERGQEFYKPCTRNIDDYNVVQNIA